ncbi:MAG: MATE family efflux transporter [Treponema sp.]|jgi:putative MATE family efflux protein|nr:MATE family efflux transporter [Treponema sp.]
MSVQSMTSGRPFGLLVRFAIPLMLGDIIQQMYTIADSMVVGRLIGVNAFAAVSASGALYWLIQAVIFGFSHGFGALMAQRFGAGNYPGLRRVCALSLRLAFVIGLVMTGLCLALSKTLLTAMNTPPEILDDAALYLGILSGGITAVFINSVVFSVFRATGDSKTPLYVFIASSVLNIILDVVLVLYTPMGVAAVSAATTGVQFLSAGFNVWYLVKHTGMKFAREDFVPGAPLAGELLRLGAPLGARNCAAAAGGIIIQYIINGYGTVFIAGIAAAKKLYSVLFIMGSGMEGAAAAFVAQNYGAGRFDRITSGVRSARRIMFAGLVVIIPFMFLFGRRILGALVSGEDAQIDAVLDTAVKQLRVCLVLLPFLYMLLLYRSGLQGMGNSFTPMVSGLLEAALRIAAVLVLPLFLGVRGVFLSEPIGWPVMAVQLYAAYVSVVRQKEKRT